MVCFSSLASYPRIISVGQVFSHAAAFHQIALIAPPKIQGIHLMSTSALSGGSADLTVYEVRQKKQELRKEIRASMKELSSSEVARQSQLIWDQFFALPQYQLATSVGLFVSMPSGEIQTDYALKRVIRDSKTLYVPRVGLNFEMCDMELVRCDDDVAHDADGQDDRLYKSWPRNKWGIPEPPSICSNVARKGDIDILVVPGIAFDRNGHRLGQGKGYYDRFISTIQDREVPTKPWLVAVALTPQYIGGENTVEQYKRSVPVTDHDIKMDVIITPSCTIVCQQK
jgi:5-formyltetrahydrofolate cyclo-ligase